MSTRVLLKLHREFKLHTPSPGHLVWIGEFEFPTIASPRDEALTASIGE